MVRTQHVHCRGLGLISGQGTKIPQAPWHGKKKKKRKERGRGRDGETEGDREPFGVSSYKGTNPIRLGPHPNNLI